MKLFISPFQGMVLGYLFPVKFLARTIVYPHFFRISLFSTNGREKNIEIASQYEASKFNRLIDKDGGGRGWGTGTHS